MTTIKIEEILAKCDRYVLKDYAFGDSEITWVRDGEQVAWGYKGSSGCDITVQAPDGGYVKLTNLPWNSILFQLGTLVSFERNDGQFD